MHVLMPHSRSAAAAAARFLVSAPGTTTPTERRCLMSHLHTRSREPRVDRSSGGDGGGMRAHLARALPAKHCAPCENAHIMQALRQRASGFGNLKGSVNVFFRA